MDYKEMWNEAYQNTKEEHPDWTDEQLEKAATNGMSEEVSNLIDALKND